MASTHNADNPLHEGLAVEMTKVGTSAAGPSTGTSTTARPITMFDDVAMDRASLDFMAARMEASKDMDKFKFEADVEHHDEL